MKSLAYNATREISVSPFAQGIIVHTMQNQELGGYKTFSDIAITQIAHSIREFLKRRIFK